MVYLYIMQDRNQVRKFIDIGRARWERWKKWIIRQTPKGKQPMHVQEWVRREMDKVVKL